MPNQFTLKSPYKPAGDQPQAIKHLLQGLTKTGHKIRSGADSEIKKNTQPNRQTLLGVTGSGKTYTMAEVIAASQKPALVISHNKTLTAQLTAEFKEFFPDNSVNYFVSYYDYYQPEAYIPRTDTYIAKDSAINDEIDRLRHAAMEAVLTRSDVIVVASVSCIYGLGRPTDYLDLRLVLKKGAGLSRQEVLRKLTQLQYERNDTDLSRGRFRVRGDVIDIHPAGEDLVLRLEFFGSRLEQIVRLDDLTGEVINYVEEANIFPATFFITNKESMHQAMAGIRLELQDRVQYFKKLGKAIEAQRILERTTFDLEMITQIGYVSGIENYSRHIDGRGIGEPPATLIDYFIHAYGRDGFLTFVDESHMTIPQIGGMQAGDAARKESLVRFGFRLPSAKDNRPLKFNEFEDRLGQTIFVSATPRDYEHNTSHVIVEQIVRPTGLLDPTIEVRPTEHQIDDIMDEIQKVTKKKQRVLVTTLTKRMAEELSTYLVEMGIKSAYIHSEVDTLERLEILRDLRLGTYDVLVGINLLREGLDLPEVSLVAIMDADKEGYLRSTTALIQTMGRAARHIEGHVIMYADTLTGSIQQALKETKRRRKIQTKYNKDHKIKPRSITKKIRDRLAHQAQVLHLPEVADIPADERRRVMSELESKMKLAAQNLEFEKAAQLRNVISDLRQAERPKK